MTARAPQPPRLHGRVRRGVLGTLALLVVLPALLAGCASTGLSLPDAWLVQRPVLLLGEVHDNAVQHRLRADALQRLLATGARPALLMEQFDRDRQGDLDRARARGVKDADTLIAAAGGPGWDWPLYRPVVQLALDHGLPLLAANVSRDEARRITREGLAATGFDAAVPADVEAAQLRSIVDGHCGMLNTAQARGLLPAQVARDQFMARLVEAQAVRGAVLLAGNGHVRTDAGVPRWLSPATRQRTLAVGLVEADDAARLPFDQTRLTPTQPREDPCEAFRKAMPKR